MVRQKNSLSILNGHTRGIFRVDWLLIGYYLDKKYGTRKYFTGIQFKIS